MFWRGGGWWLLMAPVGVQHVSKSVSKESPVGACLVEPPATVKMSVVRVGLRASLELSYLTGQECHAELRGRGLRGTGGRCSDRS